MHICRNASGKAEMGCGFLHGKLRCTSRLSCKNQIELWADLHPADDAGFAENVRRLTAEAPEIHSAKIVATCCVIEDELDQIVETDHG